MRRHRTTQAPDRSSSPGRGPQRLAEHGHAADVVQVDGHIAAVRVNVHLAEELQSAQRRKIRLAWLIHYVKCRRSRVLRRWKDLSCDGDWSASLA